MTPTPTGRLIATDDGVDLVLSRSIRGSVDDVWASITESDRTARWFGRWEGDAAPGATIRVQMGFEDGSPWTDVRIDACEVPTRLAVTTLGEGLEWHLEITLAARGELVELTFTQHCKDTDGLGDIGPGWEYYLDNLLASRDGTPLPGFDDYYPAMLPYFLDQIAQL